jgi:hypothetical protein
VALCSSMSSKAKPDLKVLPGRCRLSQPLVEPPAVADRMAAFLEGRTQGEDLLHELYDHILKEPIPRSMQALLKQSQHNDQIS